MNQEENNNLRFGDKIVIKGILDRGQVEYEGFLCGQGFTQPKVQFQVIPSTILQKTSESSSNLNFLTNYNDFVFQIWPRLNFQAHKELRHQNKRIDHIQKKIDQLVNEKIKRQQNLNIPDKIIEDQKRLKNDHEKYQAELQKLNDEKEYNQSIKQRIELKVESEKENNKNSLAQFAGQPIGYGSEMQIMHFDSNLFLSSQTLASDSEKSAYRFLLSGDYSSGMIFRILPKFKLRNIGDTIQYRDQILIQNLKLRFSVSFSEEQAMKGTQHQQIKEVHEYKQVERKKNDSLSFVVDTYISQYTEVVWEFRKYVSSTTEANKANTAISGGDLVRFLHKESDGYLSADITYQNQTNPEIYMRTYQGSFPEEQHSISSIWQVELCNDYNRGVPVVIGTVADPISIYLRHFQTGRLLCLNQGQFLLAQGMEERKLSSDPNSLLTFTNTKVSETQNLENLQCYHLSIQKSYLNITQESDQVYENNTKVEIPGFFHSIEDSELNLKRQKLSAIQDINDENALQIERISDQEKNDILFAFSAQPTLIRLVDIFKYNQSKENITQELLQRVIATLEQLIHFVCELAEDADLLDCQGFSIEKNQRLLRDTSFIQLLTNLLYYPFKNKFFDSQNLTILNKEMKYIFQLSYVLIKFIIREYRPNELFTSQWLELLMVQAMEYDNEVDILAEPTLTELIDNNETILKKKIDANIINKFVQLLITEKSIKYIKLLRALINCDGKAMKLNQEIIINNLLVENNDSKSLINPLLITSPDKIQIYIGDLPYELDTLKDETGTEIVLYLDYYVNLIYLFSDLCMDKQFVAIDILKKYFTYEICFTIISSPKYSESLRSAFSCLVKTCYIEGQHMQTISAPVYLKEWDKVYSVKGQEQWKQQQELIVNNNPGFNKSSYGKRFIPTFTENPDIIQCEIYLDQFDKLKEFIMSYLSSIAGDKKYQRVWLIDQNQFTLNVIKLSKSLFQYGMYNSIQDINAILKPMIQFLNATRDITNEQQEKSNHQMSGNISRNNRSNDSEYSSAEESRAKKEINRYEKTEENIILGFCRTIICDILELVNNIILNWMGDKILIKFKKFYEDNNMGNLTLLEIVEMVRSRYSYMKQLEELDPTDKESADLIADLKKHPPFDVFEQPMQWVNERVNSTEFSIDSLIQKTGKIDQSNSKDKILNLYLIDLLLYDNPNLVKASLQILEANFSKRIDLIEYLKDVQIIDDSHKNKILQRAKNQYIQLNNLVDETENWYAKNSQKGLQNSQAVIEILDELFFALTDQKVIEYIDIDEALSEEQEKHRKASDDVDEDENRDIDQLIENRPGSSHKAPAIVNQEEINEDSIMQDKLKQIQSSDVNQNPIDINSDYYHEFMYRKNVRSEIQKMFRLLQIHKPIIELILNDLAQIKKEEKTKRDLILKKCFKVLSLFCFENQINQRQLMPYIDSIIEHLQADQVNIPQILLNEIVRENEELLFDQQMVHKIVDSYCQIVNNQDLTNPQRTIFIEYLSTFMKSQDNIIRPNQIEVILSISNPKYKNILCLLSHGSKEEQVFITRSNELSKQIETLLPASSGQNTILIPYEIQYFIQQLEIMSIACEDKNDATESKSQNFFPLDDIFLLLEKTPKCWPVRKTLVQFFYHVYLETEKDLDDMDNILKIMMFIKNDLEYISNNINLFMASKLTLTNFQGTTPIKSQINIYMFGVLLFCIKESANRSLISQKDVVANFYRSILESFIKLQAILTKEDEENKLFIAQIFFIISQKKHIPKQSFDIRQIREQLLPDIVDKIKKYENQNMNLVNFQKHEKEELVKLGKLKSVSQKFHIIFNKLSDTYSFQNIAEQEFQHLTQTMKGILHLSKKAFKNKNTITFESLCKKFCSIINPSNSILSEEYFIVGMRIFRKFIEAENTGISIPAADWDGDIENENQITHKQNILADYGVMQVVCNFLQPSFSKELKSEAILLGIAMLYGGNTKCQEHLFECLQNDTSNSVMMCLYETIDLLSSKIKKSMAKRNNQFFEKFRSRIDDIQKLKRALTQGTQKIEELEIQKQEQQKEKELMKEKQEQELLIQEIHASANVYDEDQMILNLTRIYRLLQLFCEGHYLPLQNYLREQRQNGDLNPKSIDFIKLISQNFGSYIRYMNDKTVGLGQQIIDLLIESVQGPCQQNQKCISDNRIVDHTKELLSNFSQNSDYEKRGIDSNELKDEVNEVVAKSTLLLVSLLEGNNEKEIPLYIDQQLDFGFIRQFLAQQYSDLVKDDLNMELEESTIEDIIEKVSETSLTFSDQVENAFNMYILIATISDQLNRLNPDVESEASKYIKLKTENIEDQAMDFFSKNTCNIEVFFQEKIARVFFIIQPACRNISKKTREKFMNEVDRGTLNDKLGSLTSEAQTFFTEMDHMTNLKGWFIHFTSYRFSVLKLFSTFLSFLINIVMVAVLDRSVFDNNSKMDESQATIFTLDASKVMNALGIIQLVCNLVMMVFWLVLNVPIILTQKWHQFTEKNSDLIEQRLEDRIEELGLPKYFPTQLTTYALKTKGPTFSKFQENGKLRLGNIWGYAKYYETSFMFLMKDGTFLYLIFYIACTILGFFFDKIIYSFQLLDIINQFPTLRNVTLAVESNANQLLKTFLLGVIVIFIYSVIGYSFAVDSYFFGDQGASGENLCSNLFHCFLESLNLGLRNGGGVGDSMRVESFEYGNRGMFIFRIIFDVTFFALINVIFINIIFGIIIDTFAELRDKKSEVAEDMTNICFICGLERYVFDKNADGFDNHIERDHQLWNYIFYMYFLQKKDYTDYNGIETDVVSKIETSDISWFPMMKSISLGEQEEKDDLADKVTLNLDEMNNSFKELYDKVNNLSVKMKKEQQLAKQLKPPGK